MALLCLAVLPTPLGRHSWLAGAASQNCGSDFIQPLGISIGFIYPGREKGTEVQRTGRRIGDVH